MRKLLTVRLPEEMIAKVKEQKGGYTRFIEEAIRYRLNYFEKLAEKTKAKQALKEKKESEDDKTTEDELNKNFIELFGSDVC